MSVTEVSQKQDNTAKLRNMEMIEYSQNKAKRNKNQI